MWIVAGIVVWNGAEYNYLAINPKEDVKDLDKTIQHKIIQVFPKENFFREYENRFIWVNFKAISSTPFQKIFAVTNHVFFR